MAERTREQPTPIRDAQMRQVMTEATILRREPMDAASIRLPHADMVAARKLAKAYKCQLADILRTAVHTLLAETNMVAQAAEA